MVAMLIQQNMEKFRDGREANLNPFFRAHNNCAVFPNIMGGFAIIHSTVNINEDKPFSTEKQI
jgi:hypothetical protein